jgi:hypothetical protein
MPRKIVFYSKQEINELEQIKMIDDRHVRKSEMVKFCRKTNRTFHAVTSKLSSLRTKKPKQPKEKTATISASEFVIPVKKYELREINGQLNIVIKF